MKHAVKIFAFILVAALPLAACNRAPVPPIPEETAAETTRAPDVSAAPDTTGIPETAAPETKPAETKSAETTAPITTASVTTKEPETTTPVTTPSVTTEPVTIQTPETTAAETVVSESFFSEALRRRVDCMYLDDYEESVKRFPNSIVSGVIAPFYWIDEAHVGVRGFEEVVLSTEGQYVSVKEYKGIDYRYSCPAFRSFTLIEKPTLNERPQNFPFVGEGRAPLLTFSEKCQIQYGHVMNFDGFFDPVSGDSFTIASWCLLEKNFLPISKENNGKNIVVLEYTDAYVNYYDMFLVIRWSLNDDLSRIESTELLSSVPAGDVIEYSINGEYGFMVSCVARTKDENGKLVEHYAFFATNDGGNSWVMYDPQTPGTPEITLERTSLY